MEQEVQSVEREGLKAALADHLVDSVGQWEETGGQQVAMVEVLMSPQGPLQVLV